jgi:predicted lipoprotein with Yx(FWY)xxD motif
MRKRFVLPLVSVALVMSTGSMALARQVSPATSKPLVGVSHNAKFGKILVNAIKTTSLNKKTYPKGFTLYHLLKENTGTFACTGGCLTFWPPLLLPAGVSLPKGAKGVTDKLSFVNRPGVGRQVTYDGWPLYFFQPDKKPGQTNGDGVKAFNSVWRVVPPTPMVHFTINLAPDSTWGSVTLKYTYRGKKFHSSCSQNTCKLRVHAGVKIALSETATSPASWPFSGWSVQPVNGGKSSTSTKPSITVKSNDDYNVTATYVLK